MLEKPKAKFRPEVKIAGFVLLFAAFGGSAMLVKSMGWLSQKEGPASSVPPTMGTPAAPETAMSPLPEALGQTLSPLPPDAPVKMPGTVVGCTDAFPMRWKGYAWNAQTGAFFANGGPESTDGSLMCQNGIHLSFARHDDNNVLQTALVDFATAFKNGQDNPSVGTHFITLMGDGYPGFLPGANKVLASLGANYKLKVVGAVGRSYGEDACMGPKRWLDNPQSMRGSLILTVLKDGDQMVCIHYAADNGLCVNSNDKTYDPNCVNFLSADSYMKAVEDLAAHRCVDLRNTQTGKTENRCADGVGTWTPGDVNAAKKIGGLVKVASTRRYSNQMPSVVIGLAPWMETHRKQTVAFLKAVLEGGAAVKSSRQALDRGAEISDKAYDEKDTGPAYWKKYYLGVVENDKLGQPVQLGGSEVFDLSDNIALFGLRQGIGAAYRDTYDMIGRIVVKYYPQDIPSVPAYADAVDTSYLMELVKAAPTVQATIQAPSFKDVVASSTMTEVARRPWSITFDTGQSSFSPMTEATLRELKASVVGAPDTAVEIHGHTDNQGNPDANRALSEARAFAVVQWLQAQDPARCPPSRFRVTAHGQENPVAPNTTETGRAQNRRVEVVLLSK